MTKKEKKEKLHNTIRLFFLVHFGAIFLNLLKIMIECGTLNPYTYKGLNQKYFISTGDHLPGITFDSPVTTAIISAFGLLYFLYRRHFRLSLLAAIALALIGSNLTNIFVGIILVFIFIFNSDKIQKSFIILHLLVFIIFLARISPRDNEYLGRVIYGIIDKPYDLPKKNESLDFIKMQPDSLLDSIDIRKKIAVVYLDSMSAVRAKIKEPIDTIEKKPGVVRAADSANSEFFEFREQKPVADKINRYHLFIEQNYPASRIDSLKMAFDWKKPGKWIAYLELYHFIKNHKGKMITGAGIGNFSSRTAFKVTSLGMAGAYPKKFSYVHPWFLNNHLYLYLNYHSQNQMKHVAANTPDSTYSQLLGEYGLLGLLLFSIFYVGFFVRRIRYLSFGLPLLLLLLMAFSVEYWMEQLSVVILFDALMFLDLKSKPPGPRQEKEGLSS